MGIGQREQKESARLQDLYDLDYLAGRSVAVAFSGGVDSTFLLWALSRREEGPGGILAITAASPLCPDRETREAEQFCRERGIAHRILQYDPLDADDPASYVPGFADNPPDRCYLCKRQLFTRLQEEAKAWREDAVLVDGTNADDSGDYRPGLRALDELGVRSPLKDAAFSKQEIRSLLRAADLPVWEKPALACLATRFPYGEKITKEGLERAGRAEQLLWDLGFSQVRVRVHGGILARIEVPGPEISRIMEQTVRERVTAAFRELGFIYTSLDLAGYKMGSMNDMIQGR